MPCMPFMPNHALGTHAKDEEFLPRPERFIPGREVCTWNDMEKPGGR